MNKSTKEKLDRILSVEMDRAEFLRACGIGILAAVGVSGVLKTLAGAQPKQKAAVDYASAYGGRNFGG